MRLFRAVSSQDEIRIVRDTAKGLQEVESLCRSHARVVLVMSFLVRREKPPWNYVGEELSSWVFGGVISAVLEDSILWRARERKVWPASV